MEDLTAAVPSFRGLHLTIVDNAHPVSLTAFLPLHDGDSIKTSLRVRFAALVPGFDDESQVIFYAATPGAFVDLAADFAYALDTPIVTASLPARFADSTNEDGHDGRDQTDGDGLHRPNGSDIDGPIVLDADLPPTTTTSGLTGLEERSTIDRALGVLIDQGHHPDGARAVLRQHAAAAGVALHIYATQLLRD